MTCLAYLALYCSEYLKAIKISPPYQRTLVYKKSIKHYNIDHYRLPDKIPTGDKLQMAHSENFKLVVLEQSESDKPCNKACILCKA